MLYVIVTAEYLHFASRLRSVIANFRTSTMIIYAGRPFTSVVKRTLSVREVLGSILPGPVSSDAVWLTAHHRCDVSSELRCSTIEPRRWAPPLVTREYNKDLILFTLNVSFLLRPRNISSRIVSALEPRRF